jgi:hypothetical protein
MVKKSFTTMDMFPVEIIKGLGGLSGSMWCRLKRLDIVFHPGVMGMRDA